MEEKQLKKSLSMFNMIAISSGAVIGGWLAEAPYWFELTGAGSAIVFVVLSLLLVPVGFAFAELTAMLPYASGVNIWTTKAYGQRSGFFTQWMLFLVQVVEPPMMAFIFGTVINHFYPLNNLQMTLIAIAVLTIWYILSNFDIKLQGNLSTIFFVVMIAASLIVSFSFYFSSSWDASNLTVDGGLFSNGGRGIFIAMAVLSLKYIGFEMTPTMIEETTFPVKDVWKVILSALLVPALLYLIVVFAIGGMAPSNQIAEMTMPEPELVAINGLPRILGVIAVVSGLLHAFTTMMGFWTSSARVLYGSAELGQLPRRFSKLNKHGQPTLSNLIVFAFSIFFCLFSGTNWVQYIYAISSIAAGIVYFVVCMDVLKLRGKNPDLERPFKAPGGKVLMFLGMIISVWIIIGASIELDLGGYISLALFFVMGLILYMFSNWYKKRYPHSTKDFKID